MPPSFHVLGPGGLGLLTAFHLRQAACPVTLLVRDWRTAQRFEQGGSQITLERSFKGRHEVLSVDATCEPIFTAVTPPQRAHAAAQPQQAPIHNLVVATKSHDVVRAVRSVLHRLTPESNLLLVQNGLLAVFQELQHEVLRELEHQPRVILATLTHGCHVTLPFHVVHAGYGSAALAEVDASLPHLIDAGHAYRWQVPPSEALQCLLDDAGLREGLGVCAVDSHTALLQQLHAKLAINCCVNPLTALLGCLNGQLLTDAHAKETMRSVCRELFELFPQHLSATSESELFDTVYSVALATSKNKSSMLQDVLNGRLTENEYLSGYVVREAARAKKPAPVNETLYRLMKARERLSAEAVSGVKQISLSDP